MREYSVLIPKYCGEHIWMGTEFVGGKYGLQQPGCILCLKLVILCFSLSHFCDLFWNFTMIMTICFIWKFGGHSNNFLPLLPKTNSLGARYLSKTIANSDRIWLTLADPDHLWMTFDDSGWLWLTLAVRQSVLVRVSQS